MALLSKAIEDKTFDVRMIQRGLNKGLMTRDEVEKNTKKIADDSSNADYIDVTTLFESVGKEAGLR